MANLPQQDTIKQYLADGVESQFIFTFYVPLDADINVYVTLSGEDPIPSDDIKILNVDYSVTFNSDITTGGYITFLTGKIPPNGATVTLSRDVDASLDVEFSNAQTFNGTNLDDALDRLLLLIQQNKTLINSDQQRVLSYRVNAFETDSNVTANCQIPVLATNEIWIGTGAGVATAQVSEVPSASVLRDQLVNNSPGTDGARLVGYYDTVNTTATTVQAFLANIDAYIAQQFAGALWQPGDMKEFAGTTVQTGWLACDGSAVSRTTYAALFAAIGTAWGTGDGSTTFNLPDFRRRVAVGSGGSGTSVLGNAVGNTGGEEDHVLTISEMPAHDHPGSTMTGAIQAYCSAGGSSTYNTTGGAGTTAITIASQGDGAAHNIIQPSAVVTKIIKY